MLVRMIFFMPAGKSDRPTLERAKTSTGPDGSGSWPLRMSRGKLFREAAMLDDEFDAGASAWK